MYRTLTAGTLLTGLLLAGCASTQTAPPALVEARAAVRSAEIDRAVQANAPLELKRANASLARADNLHARGEPADDVDRAAYAASQQARTARAISLAKSHDAAVAMSQVERERARADAPQRAALLQRQPVDLQASQTERGMLVTLADVLFEFDRAEVKPSAQASLRKLADYLQQYPARQVLIEGFTDDVGAAGYNQALSLRRANAVDSALAGMGVATQRMATVGYGEEFPVAANSTDTDRALNRRVEVYIAENDQPVRWRR